MTENDLFALIIENLQQLMIEYGGPADLEVVRGYQSTQQGRTEPPCIYLNRQSLQQYGSPRDSYEKNPETGVLKRINSQVINLQIQFQASLTYDPNEGLRVGDLLNLASRIMGTPHWRQVLLGSGVQILRIDTNGITYVQNDRDQYEPVPVLLVTFSYSDNIVSEVPVVTSVDYKIKRI